MRIFYVIQSTNRHLVHQSFKKIAFHLPFQVPRALGSAERLVKNDANNIVMNAHNDWPILLSVVLKSTRTLLLSVQNAFRKNAFLPLSFQYVLRIFSKIFSLRYFQVLTFSERECTCGPCCAPLLSTHASLCLQCHLDHHCLTLSHTPLSPTHLPTPFPTPTPTFHPVSHPSPHRLISPPAPTPPSSLLPSPTSLIHLPPVPSNSLSLTPSPISLITPHPDCSCSCACCSCPCSCDCNCDCQGCTCECECDCGCGCDCDCDCKKGTCWVDWWNIASKISLSNSHQKKKKKIKERSIFLSHIRSGGGLLFLFRNDFFLPREKFQHFLYYVSLSSTILDKGRLFH